MKCLLPIVILFILAVESQAQGRRGSSRTPVDTGSGRRAPYVTSAPVTPASRQRNNPSNNPNRKEVDDDDDSSEEDDGQTFECPRQDGLFADPSDCKRFYLCGGWHPYSQACPPSLYFDDKLKFCTFKTAALVCGPVAEETAEERQSRNQTNLPVCNRETCQLPNCFCSEDGTLIPGDLAPEQTPQFILLGFSGAINQLVLDQYKKILGYGTKYGAKQHRLNPNGCGIRATFFVNHEYCNYAEVQWMASRGHEIAIHSITHRLPELWWTDTANYSEWAEEIIGMREILLRFANGGATGGNGLNRENVAGMRAPYLKPGGDAMFEMAHDFGLLYDSSVIAPRGSPPYWPFTWDHRQPFSCGQNLNNNVKVPENEQGATLIGTSRGGQRAKRDTGNRNKRNVPFLGRPLKCPSKPYPGLWEIPINPLHNEFNTCPSADQCVFPSSVESSNPSDIIDFLKENFDRHYQTNRAPFLLNFHVNWFTSKTKVRALYKFIDSIIKDYRDAYFVTYTQLIQWMRDPQTITNLDIKCTNRSEIGTCNRPHTCVLKHYIDKDQKATTADKAAGVDTRYMSVCHPTGCPNAYPWYGNHIGAKDKFKTVMQLVEEAVGDTNEPNDQGGRQ